MTIKNQIEIDNFIKNIKVFEMAKNGIELISYLANSNENSDCQKLHNANSLVNSAYVELINSIGKIVHDKTIDNSNDLIVRNLEEIIVIINNLENSIPSKSELVNMLISCKEIFSAQNIIAVSLAINNEQNFRNCKLELQEIWEGNLE